MRNIRILAAAILAATISATALAQTAPPSTELEPIIVTAQRRAENLQDVPISVLVMTGSGLEQMRVETTSDLQFVVPSLVYGYVSVFAQPYLRGVGSSVAIAGADASVATYVDGVYQASEEGIIQNLLGVERVEVLEGPQGTLYGRNAVGGAINVYTQTPTHDLDAKLTATGGNFSRNEVAGHIAGGITDTLAVGLYAAETTRDTYLDIQDNLSLLSPVRQKINAVQTANKQDGNKEKARAVRFKAVWAPTDALKLTGSADYMLRRSVEGGAFENITPYAAGFLFYTPGLPTTVAHYLAQSSTGQQNDTEQFGFTLREELDLGWSKILGVSNYHHLFNSGADDVSATFAPLLAINVPQNGIESEQLSQELQLLSPSESLVQWITGVFLYSELSQFNPQNIESAVILPAPVYTLNTYGKVRTHSAALFGQATIPLNMIADSLRFTIGGRYTADKKYWYGAYTSALDETGALISGAGTSFPRDDHRWNKFTPKVTLDYKIGKTLVYATYSKGFKAGVYNIAAPTAVGPVNPENLSAYEIGSKSEVAGGRIRLNTAAYYYDFTNLQVQRADLSANGSATTLQNAAAATMYGLEGNIAAKVTEKLTLTGAVSAMHAKYDTFTGAAAFIFNNGPSPGFNAPALIDASGNTLARSPKFVETLGAEYVYPLRENSRVVLAANAYFNSGFFFDSANQLHQGSYHLIDASAQYTFPNGQWSARAWGKNLTDTYHADNETAFQFGAIAQASEPRMYGLTIDYAFKK